ncbi:drs2 neo1 protein [Sporothrix curviconia]|uniref:Drs2 neo1 protein n=1 Tax=Sporothrix curviconia TaxID=1260050 RepID=A0ABP0BZD5_9PEZI
MSRTKDGGSVVVAKAAVVTEAGATKEHDADAAAATGSSNNNIAPAANAVSAPIASAAAAVRAWLSFVLFHILLREVILQPSPDGRHIPLQLTADPARPPHLVDVRRGHGYLSNAIRTSRYTVLNFVPKQLLFQFTRVGNFYFLCVGIPQTIPGISTTGNFTTILPLLFFVLLTVVKEGYDDYKRHRLDKVENAGLATVLRRAKGHDGDNDDDHYGDSNGQAPDVAAAAVATKAERRRRSRRVLSSVPVVGPWLAKRFLPETPVRRDGRVLGGVHGEACRGFQWAHVQWRDIRVGDVVRMVRDEDVPADLLLLHADGEGGLAYVETMALDGETNLKSKQVPAPLAGGRCATIEGLVETRAELVVEDPNPDLYRFNGRIAVDNPDEGDDAPALPLTLAEVIYRGSTLRNTPCAIGLVLNTGEECKSRMNANRHPRAKKPALERVTNGIVLLLAAFVVLLAAGCSIGYYIWRRATEQKSWYISMVSVPAEEIILGFAIQFNNVIPLALYVSLEIVKLGQMLLVNADGAMYDSKSDTPARCNTNTILENLGQIGYVFSDKTGTLTENVMQFRKMSVAGTSWLHEVDIEVEELEQGEEEQEEEEDAVDNNNNRVLDAAEGRASDVGQLSPRITPRPSPRPTPRPSTDGRHAGPVAPSSQLLAPPVEAVHAQVQRVSRDSTRRSSSHWRSTARPDHIQPELTTIDLLEYVRLRPSAPFTGKVVTYILAMALCHTCLPELKDGKVVGFQASSPDELALVRAAESLGFLVVRKSASSTTLRFTYDPTAAARNGGSREETYEVVDVIEFSSQRKRMSVIVRRPDGRLWLICKGADSMVLPRLTMAPLALQRAQNVRQSADLERALLRKSEQCEPRSSFGGPASVTIRRSIGGSVHREKLGTGEKDKAGGGFRSVTIREAESSDRKSSDRSRSFDIQKTARRSMDAFRLRPSLGHRTPSFEVRSSAVDVDALRRSSTSGTRPTTRRILSPTSPHMPSPLHTSFSPLPDKFAFLETAAFLETLDDESSTFDQCFRHMDEFAAEGLRTLLFAHRVVSDAEYSAWKASYLKAATSLDNREERIEVAAEAIEQNLQLIGASAIEDKLQEGVPEAMDTLRRANIKIWMLTGDKRETAINIAHSARLCRPSSAVYVLDASKGDLAGQLLHVAESLGLPDIDMVTAMNAAGQSTPKTTGGRIRKIMRKIFQSPFSSGQILPSALARDQQQRQRGHSVVVIDGHTLGVIEAEKKRRKKEAKHKQPAAASSVLPLHGNAGDDPDLDSLFYSIIPSVDSVICCRASPAQKALLVRSIRHGPLKKNHPGLTLAIGDGANDLAMLAEAHVGIGVSGKEGLQAARVADYSIAQFRFLARLLLVHGRWNYVRTARFILATFYKEMFFYTPAAAYQWYCGYTGTSIYESWSLTVLNTLFTSLCVIVPGIFEQDLSASVLMAVPELYAYGQQGQGLSPRRYLGWMLTAVAQGVMVWFICWAGYGAFSDGHDWNLFALGNLCFSVCIMWTNIRLFLLNTHYKTAIVLAAFGITVAGWWLWCIFLALAYSPSPSPYDVRGGFFTGFGRTLSWWATLLIAMTWLSVMELGFRAVKRNLAIAGIWGRAAPLGSKTQKVWSWFVAVRRFVFCGMGGGPAAATNNGTTVVQRRRGGGGNNGGDDCDDECDDDDYGEGNGDGSNRSSEEMEMSADRLHVGLWQEMEQDPDVRARLRQMNGETDEWM